MVSLEDQINYLNRISNSPKLSAFNQLLMQKGIAKPKGIELRESDEIYFGIISAIQSNDKMAFEIYYNKKSKSNPNKESPAPFVNDDFLIFSIILGVAKFNLDKRWIQNIVSIRSRNAVTTTLDNLLTENYYSKSNLPEVVLMFMQLVSQRLITSDFINFTFKKINENITLFNSRSDFQILCAICSYNSIILLKEAPEGSEMQLLKAFSSNFQKRAKVLSWMLQLLLLFGFLFGLLKLPFYSPNIVKAISDYGYIFTILGAIGFTFLGNQIGFIRRISNEFLMRLMGFPKELINNKRENK